MEDLVGNKKRKSIKRMPKINKVLKTRDNHFKIYLNTQYPLQENALNSIPESPSNVKNEKNDNGCRLN